MRLKNRVALIFAGASGLGRASAMACAQDGAAIVIADINEAWAEQTIAAIGATGGTAVFLKTDACSEEAVKATVEKTVAEFGALNILINSAGLAAPDGGDNWHGQIDLYLKGPFYACKYGVEEMLRAGGGSIVNIASISGVTGGVSRSVDETGYPAAKHGLIGLTRTIALAYAKRNIRCNAICPGYIRTEMTRRIYTANDGGQSMISETLRVPMDRWGEPHEIGKVAAFLASDDSSFITGQPIIVDGGFMAR
jgi:NAD(P)-dependent dehydrogenase (short-subunit alcohol dehydrogenase family)